MGLIDSLKKKINDRENGNFDNFFEEIDIIRDADSERAFESSIYGIDDPDDDDAYGFLDDILYDDEIEEGIDPDLGEDTDDEFDFANEQFDSLKEYDVLYALEAMIGDDDVDSDLEKSLNDLDERLFDPDDDDYDDISEESLKDIDAMLDNGIGDEDAQEEASK